MSIAVAESMFYDAESRKACAMGFHAWVPWLELPTGAFRTWCCRPGCSHTEEYLLDRVTLQVEDRYTTRTHQESSDDEDCSNQELSV